MIYCMSDIHGEYEKYLAMLELIQFSEKDRLFVLGDCIDRGKRGIDILMDIMERSNVTLLAGNHEAMMLDGIRSGGYRADWDIWKQNGSQWTRKDFFYRRTDGERQRILQFLEGLPEYVNLTVGERKFHLVHGYPGNDRDSRLWDRPEKGGVEPVPGAIAIVGHTPTVLLHGDDGSPYSIWHGTGILCIDCGCGSGSELSRLACLRLDDMQEFYI